MAQYRGTLTGQRGNASRLGSKTSGLSAHIASWQGAIDVDLWHDSKTGTDMARVTLCQHLGSGQFPSRVLYDGPVSGEGAEVLAASRGAITCDCNDAYCETCYPNGPGHTTQPNESNGCQASGGWTVLVIGRETSSDICRDCGATRSDHVWGAK